MENQKQYLFPSYIFCYTISKKKQKKRKLIKNCLMNGEEILKLRQIWN